MKEEIWVSVKGFEGIYEVSNLGRVKSLNRFVKYTTKEGGYQRKEKILNQKICDNGYNAVRLFKNAKGREWKVHIVVAENFGLPKSKGQKYINHKNGCKTDNRLDNLEWCTQSENMIHAYENGFAKGQKGSDHPGNVLTEEEVIKIRKLHSGGMVQRRIAEEYGVCFQTISLIVNRKTWTHI